MAKVKETSNTETDDIRRQHQRLIDRVNNAADDLNWWQRTLEDSRMKQVLADYDTGIETAKESLVYADKKEIDGIQANVKARRTLLSDLRQKASADELVKLRRELDDFQRNNALFLQPAEEKKAAKEA